MNVRTVTVTIIITVLILITSLLIHILLPLTHDCLKQQGLSGFLCGIGVPSLLPFSLLWSGVNLRFSFSSCKMLAHRGGPGCVLTEPYKGCGHL